MEIRIRTGAGIKCEYTGEEGPVLVRLVEEAMQHAPMEGNMERVVRDSGWMGRKALEDALKILDSMEGKTTRAVDARVDAMRNQCMMATVDPDYPTVVPAGTLMAKMPPDPKAQVDAFAREIANLVANPPQTRENEKAGLSESHLREVMKRFLPTFRNPVASMFPALHEHVGMPRERFDTLVGILKNG